MRLMCDFALDFRAVEKLFSLKFAEHFALEMGELRDLAADGLLALDDDGLRVLPGGRLLIRNIAMVFDEYLRNRKEEVKFSKVI
jgi:oxygen-independent coproporphyrinogen-3 oxidase